MAIELQPATNPLDIPSPKPSAIVRHWPDKMWGQRYAKARNQTTGHITFCAIGIGNEVDGYKWGEPDSVIRDEDGNLVDVWLGGSYSDPLKFFMYRYGLTRSEVSELVETNDREGKDAAARYLERIGM